MAVAKKKNDHLRDYNEVAQRVEGFNEEYPTGRIVTTIEYLPHELAAEHIAVRAQVFKTQGVLEPDATGLSWLKLPGSTNFTRGSELENAETSAVGRALAFIGFYAKGESLASKQEIAAKKSDGIVQQPKAAPKPVVPQQEDPEADVVGQTGLTNRQKALMFATLRDAGVPDGKRKELVHTITGKTSTTTMNSDDLDLVLTFAKGGKFREDEEQAERDSE